MENCVVQHKEMECALLQCLSGRIHPFKNAYKPLGFLHFSDIHADIENWNRIVEYMNYYKDYIEFALHTGDFCGGDQGKYADMYRDGTLSERPVLNCVGNHDCLTVERKVSSKEAVFSRLFHQTQNWDVQFMDGQYTMAYYKDFPESKIRLIVLNQYYDTEAQLLWLSKVLASAKEEGLYVITATHQPVGYVKQPLPTAFSTIMDFEEVGGQLCCEIFEDVLARYIRDGGLYICNLCGHLHHDVMGYTEKGILNIVVEMATNNEPCWSDAVRIRNTHTEDCFNAMSVDINTGCIRIVRIGNNTDYFLRQKHTLCYDFLRKNVIHAN